MKVDWPSMSGGEIGEELLSRSDTARYRVALRRARNVIGLAAGGQMRRPGMRYAGRVKDIARRTRVIPFQFSVNQGYAVELGHLTMRFLSMGGYVLRKELLITGITNGFPATVNVTAHGYQVGWDVVFENILGMTEINGLQARVLSVTANSFTIDLDTTGFGVFTGSGGGVAGNAAGGTGGDPAPPAPTPPTTPPPPPPPFYDNTNLPPIFSGGGLIFAPPPVVIP